MIREPIEENCVVCSFSISQPFIFPLPVAESEGGWVLEEGRVNRLLIKRSSLFDSTVWSLILSVLADAEMLVLGHINTFLAVTMGTSAPHSSMALLIKGTVHEKDMS